jgi:hypothetical protein
MDMVEKKLIEFMHSLNENLENAKYCNQLTSELLEIIYLQHKGSMFKGVNYDNKQKLQIDIAKYYVKAFQIYSAIQKAKKIINLLGIGNEINQIVEFPFSVQPPVSDLHIAYNYSIHVHRFQKLNHIFDTIENQIQNENTFLPSLEEMDQLVNKTKKTIQDIEIPQLIKTIELFLEKKQFQDLQKIFSNI